MGGGIGKIFHRHDPRAEAAKKTSTKIMQVLAKKKGEVDKSGQPMSFEKYDDCPDSSNPPPVGFCSGSRSCEW
jgi:hypothetical protein